MSEGLLVALLAALGVVGGTAVTAAGVAFGVLWRRIGDLEERLSEVASDADKVRWWAFDVKDLYYKHRTPGAPDLPPIPEPTQKE